MDKLVDLVPKKHRFKLGQVQSNPYHRVFKPIEEQDDSGLVGDDQEQVELFGYHTKNFIDAIRNNTPESLNCGIDSGSIACINAHMGNISYKVGRKIFWDKEKQNFGDDVEANDLITPKYNNGFKLPT